MVDLADDIDYARSEALNATRPLADVTKQGMRDQKELVCESDADEQLLMHIAFNANVKLHSIAIDGPDDGRAPRDIKLFVNRNALGFDDAEDDEAEQAFCLEPAQLGERLELRFVRFQSVDRLSLFVASNQDGGETTAVSGVPGFHFRRTTCVSVMFVWLCS